MERRVTPSGASAGRPARRARPRQPHAEGLEARLLLYSATGGAWVYGSRITYSFAPDGTDVGGTGSSWFQRMTNLGYSQATWQAQFRRAAAVWQQFANINLVEVSDDGSAYAVSGNQQSDSRFGDIRIAGRDLGGSTLASAYLPPSFNGGTLAGDIIMNTSMAWNVNSHYDIQTVAIHELGHALGLDHSTITAAEMYQYYNNVKQSLNSDDISGMQSVYGTRPADAYDADGANNVYTTADNLSSLLDAQGRLSVSGLDLSTSTDSDWFKVVTPSSTTGTLTVKVQSSALSSLSPKLMVYSGSLSLLGTASSTDYGATVTVTVNSVSSGQTYYLRALAGASGPSSVGAYGLLVNFGNGTQDPIAPPSTVVTQQSDQGGGSQNQASAPKHRRRLAGHQPNEVVLVGALTGTGESFVARRPPKFAQRVRTIVNAPLPIEGEAGHRVANTIDDAGPSRARGKGRARNRV